MREGYDCFVITDNMSEDRIAKGLHDHQVYLDMRTRPVKTPEQIDLEHRRKKPEEAKHSREFVKTIVSI